MGSLLGGLIAGGVSSIFGGKNGQVPNAPDYSALIAQAQANYNRQIQQIQGLSGNISGLFPGYQNAGNTAANNLGNTIQNAQQALLNNTAALYNPNGGPVQAAQSALQQSVYAGLPATENAVRQSLAATGGFQRGAAGVALAQPALQAANTVAQGNAGIQAQNLARQQGALQGVYNTVANMTDQQAQQIFGMNVNQAQTILQYGTQAQIQQLADMLGAGTNENNTILGAIGANINSQANQNIAQTNLNNQVVSGEGQLISGGILGALNGLSALGTPTPTTPSMTTPSSAPAYPVDALGHYLQ
jgi:hypothetical protein